MMNALSRQLCAAVRAGIAGEKIRPPEAGIVLWNAFQRLSASRTYHAAGPNPLQPSEIEAFCRVTHLPLEPRHIVVILNMDQAWLEAVHSAQAQRVGGQKALPQVSKHALTPTMFDVAFG